MARKASRTQSNDQLSEQLVRDLGGYVRSRRGQPRSCDLHTSDLVATTLHRVIVADARQGGAMTPKGLRNLAFRIASGVVANALRSYKTATRKRMPLDSDQAASRTNPAVEPIDPALRKQLEAALRTLPADDRQLLAMRLRGAAWSEVARSMGITAPAARKRWERLRAWFVLTLDGYEL